MRGTLTELTVGDYVYNLPGFISTVTYTWEQDYPWDIALENVEGNGKRGRDFHARELPMVLNCSIEFTPIHKFTPQTGIADRFIGTGGLYGEGIDTSDSAAAKTTSTTGNNTENFNNTPTATAQTDSTVQNIPDWRSFINPGKI